MKELKRIRKVIQDLYNGEPWLEITIADTLQQINAEQAHYKIAPGINSIWEITNHMMWWRMNILERLDGKIIDSPQHNYFLPVTDDSVEAWARTREKFDHTHELWLHFMKNLHKAELNHLYPANGISYYDHIIGMVQHDAYHLGQIMLLYRHFHPRTAH